MSYNGIGATDPNHPLEVEGQVFVSNVELGNATQDVPFEVFSDYTGKATLTDSRQLRLRVTPSATTTSKAHIDMGIDNVTGNVFFISQPVFDATTAGSRDIFTIERGGNVSIGNNLTISSNIQTGNLAVTSNISTGNVSITDNLTVSTDVSVTGTLTTGDIAGDTALTISGDVSMANDLSVTGTITTSNIEGGSPLTISTGSNVQILTSNVGIGTVVDPVSNTRVHIQGGSHASITNANVFPNFIFSRSENSSNNHVGGGHNTARHAVFPDDTGKVWAVGAGNEGALGLGDATNRNVYTLVSALDGVANIVASSTSGYSGSSIYETTILLDDTGNVWTCGDNAFGNLGHGDLKNRYIPTLVSNSNIYNVSITEVSCGANSSLVLDSTGQMWGAGYNVDYRLGNLSGVTTSITTFAPTAPSGTHVFTSIECGTQHALALEDNGRIWSTGLNSNGRTGQGSSSGTTSGWTQVDNTGGVNDVSITQISAGERSSIALDSTGNVWMTGYNANGQLGLGDTSQRTSFTRVTSNINVESGVTIKKIAASYWLSAALDTAGKLWGCGRRDTGTFGSLPYTQTNTTFIRTDVAPIGDKSITDFALPHFFSLIVRTSDNEYYVAGSGGDGQLGTGDTANRYIFTKILDVNANPPPDYGYTRSLLLENTETGKGPSIELKNKNAVSSRIQMEDGTSGKLNIGFVDASFDPKLSGGDGAELYPFQDFIQSNAMTRGVTINQAGGTMVAGGSTSNIGFNTPIFSSGLLGSSMYGYADPCQLGYPDGTSLFLTTEGKVYVAGDNTNGDAGDGTNSNVNVWKESTPPMTYGPIKAFAGGSGLISVAITEQTYTYATGYNAAGGLGLGDTTGRTVWSTNTGNRIMAASGARVHQMTIAPDGTIYAAGEGSNYRLGTGNLTDQSAFTPSTSGAMASQTAKWVCSGRRQSYAIRSDDALVFVGDNGQGVAGDGGTADKTVWTVIASSNFDSKTPRAVYLCGGSSSQESARMITTDGKIYATGSNGQGELGVGDILDKTTWTAATGDIASETVTRLAMADRSTIALDSTGNVWSTGNAPFTGQGLTNADADLTTFTKITKPDEFFSKTIVNIMGQSSSIYAVDSEGTLWGTGWVRGLGYAGINSNQQFLFSKVPIYDVVPKEFKYTPTLTLENPNPDYGATVEFKNPNNRAFINLDDKTSTLRLGFVNNENNAGQFKGISISPSDNSVYINQNLHITDPSGKNSSVGIYNVEGNIGIGISAPRQKLHVGGDIYCGLNNWDSLIHGGSNFAVTSDSYILIVADANDLNTTATGDVIIGYGSAINTDSYSVRGFSYADLFPSGGPRVELLRTNSGANSIQFAGSTVHSSDDRIKINEERLTNATEILMKLDPQIYDKLITFNDFRKPNREAGLIVQDVWYDAPELRYLLNIPDDANPPEEKPPTSDNIQEDPDYSAWGSKVCSLNYTGLIPYLIKSNQEQQALIEDLRARVEALENA